MDELTHMEDFTRGNYRRLVRIAKQGYQFKRYAEWSSDERFVLWRHDIDLSMHAARKMAHIEKEEGVVATYFVNPHSEFYNLLERSVWQCARDIQQAGHELALHFDFAFYAPQDAAELERCLLADKRLLEDFFRQPIRAFSFHNPDERMIGFRDWKYAGMVNVYSSRLRAEVSYVSDSNGVWLYRRLEDVLVSASEQRLQVLTHPGMWQDSPMPPRQRVERCIQGRAKATAEFYDNLLRVAGRPNVGADAVASAVRG
jgi:hypothetical protein